MEPTISESLLFLLFFTIIFRFLQHYWSKSNNKKLTDVYGVSFLIDAVLLIKHYYDLTIYLIKILTQKNPDWFGPAVGIFVKNPADAEIILSGTKALGKDMSLYKIVVPYIGQSLLTAKVSTWKKDRKLISLSFSQKNIAGYYDIFYSNAKLLAEELRKEEGKSFFDVYTYITNINLRTICETSLGIDKDADFVKKYDELVHAADRAIELATQRLTNIWYFIDFTFNLLPISRKTKECAATYQNLMDYIINAGKARHITEKEKYDKEDTKIKRTKYLLEDLMALHQDGKRFSNQEVQDHINTIVFAGYETSASTLGYSLVILGTYPEIQEKVYQEIVDVVGLNRSIEYEDLKNLQYMERVIKETLRLYPVVPYLARIAAEEIIISSQKIPAGSNIILSALDMQRDPQSWPNPTKFDPDRFLPEEAAKRHPYSWIPFSAGPRNCIGIRYAMISMKLILTAILKDYYIKSPYNDILDIPMTVGILTKPCDGYLIKITKRNNNNSL